MAPLGGRTHADGRDSSLETKGTKQWQIQNTVRVVLGKNRGGLASARNVAERRRLRLFLNLVSCVTREAGSRKQGRRTKLRVLEARAGALFCYVLRRSCGPTRTDVKEAGGAPVGACEAPLEFLTVHMLLPWGHPRQSGLRR